MIKQLRIKNYILIDELVANLDKGLNVITGETGAGKSIMINAIDLAFANRVSKDVIKNGCDKAIVELVIENSKHDLSVFFEENGIDDLGEEIILTKEIAQNSVRTKINGSLINSEALKYLRGLFLDVHSQHQTYSFLQPKYHITLLDEYAKSFYGEKLSLYQDNYKLFQSMKVELDALQNSAQLTEAQIDFLKFQVDEIQNAEIVSETEDEELKSELEVLENVESLKDYTGASYWTINGDDGSIIDALLKIKQNISKAVSMDSKLQDIEQNFLSALEELREVGNDLRDYSQNLDNDTQRLNDIQERLYLLDKLKRKYGPTLAEVVMKGDEFAKQLSSIEYSTKNIQELEQKISQKEQYLRELAEDISLARKNYAEVLSSLIQEKLEKLELPKVRFLIDIKPKELSMDGVDAVEFLISTNISEGLKPLAKVASGGEISRVMLAIKTIFAQSDNIDTVIFDEIDTGISGKTSQSVAEEIVELADSHQIILITHQAIIASKADKHFYVRKSQANETTVEVYVLNGENKIKALAELASGDINDTSIEFARSLLAH